MIVYTKQCLCQSRDKTRLQDLKRQYDNVEVKIVNRSKEWQEEAEKYNAQYPFYVVDEVVYPFYDWMQV